MSKGQGFATPTPTSGACRETTHHPNTVPYENTTPGYGETRGRTAPGPSTRKWQKAIQNDPSAGMEHPVSPQEQKKKPTRQEEIKQYFLTEYSLSLMCSAPSHSWYLGHNGE